MVYQFRKSGRRKYKASQAIIVDNGVIGLSQILSSLIIAAK